MSTVAERVARGAAWLDEKYPQWFSKIDLSILDLGNCTQCVLGQVYTGVIPAAEQGQVLAQAIQLVTQGWPDAEEWARDYEQEVLAGQTGGYNILVDFHDLIDGGELHGFVARSSGDWVTGEDGEEMWQESPEQVREYAALLDEWTRVILRRRMAYHQNDDRVLVSV